ncbi:MAG TPA: hypothetical protein PKA64_19380 [Myxococcota bacterium]|nr:hypothetical protein [Myxococcota bacterium]
MSDRALAALLLLLAGACNNDPGTDSHTDNPDDTLDPDTPDTPDTPDDTDGDGFETDTDPFETGWGHTGAVVDTGAPAHSGQPQPSDSGLIPIDTATCPFGEKQDCNGLCFPAYFIGDGTCDDGTNGADFDCAVYSFDRGDCDQDTGAAVPIDTDLLDGCIVTIRTTTGTGASQVGWEIRRHNTNQLLYARPAGTFMQDRASYADAVMLDDDKYDFLMIDSFGDGWQGGQFIAHNPDGSVAAQGALANGGSQAVEMNVHCSVDTSPDPTQTIGCGDLEVKVTTKRDGDEVGWRVRDANNNVIGEAVFGEYSDFGTYTTTVHANTGYYTFNLRDLRGDGWAGASYTITDLGTNQILSSGSLPTGHSLDQPFAVDCSDTFEAPPPPPPPTVSCQPLAVRARTAIDGEEIGWELRDASTAELVDYLPTGGYGRNSTFVAPMLIADGTWTLTLLDANGDGWHGDTLEVFDWFTGFSFGTWGSSFTQGSSWSTQFTTACPAMTTPPAPRVCAAGSLPDCNGVCWPRAMIGDGFCDDGTTFAPNFNCQENTFDGGDCNAMP